MRAVEPLDAHDREILKERARRLSLPLEEPGGERLQVLRFLSGGHTYALECAHIREVALLPQMTPLPGVPPFVLGVVNMHGMIVAILDLQYILGIPATQTDGAGNVIILQGAASEFGLLADVIMGFESIPVASLQPPLPASADAGAVYLEGITIDGMALLAAEKLLLDHSLVVEQFVGSGR